MTMSSRAGSVVSRGGESQRGERHDKQATADVPALLIFVAVIIFAANQFEASFALS